MTKDVSRLRKSPFDEINDAIFIIDTEGRYIHYCNNAAEEMFGYSRAELAGSTTEMLHLDNEHYNHFARETESHLERSGIYKGRFNMRRRNGTSFPTSHVVTFLKMRENGSAALSIVRDETLASINNHPNALVEKLAAHLSDATDIKSAFRKILDVLCRNFNWDYGEAWISEPGNLLTFGAGWVRPGSDLEPYISLTQHIQLSSGEGLPATVQKSQKACWISDIQALPQESHRRRVLADEAGLKSTLVIPAIDTGHVAAVFVFASRQTLPEDMSIQTSTEYILTLTGPALRDLVRTRESSLLSTEALSSLFEGYPLPLWVCDPESLEILQTNKAALKLMDASQYSSHTTIADLIPGDSVESLRHDMEAATTYGDPLTTHPFKKSNGETVWITLYIYQIHSEDERKLVLAGVRRHNLQRRLHSEESPSGVEDFLAALKSLSNRERQVMNYLVDGYMSKQIAYELNLSTRTVEAYRTSLKKKLGVNTTAELFAALAAFGNGHYGQSSDNKNILSE